jgi:tRNA (cmo5U34)-methyltransferase
MGCPHSGDTVSEEIFNQDYAKAHDKRFEKLAPMRDALHLFCSILLSDLSEDAHALIVGAGTGPELFALAGAFPDFRFTVVEPAAPMLRICRTRAEDAGITDRCTFHEGTLDTLAATGPFDTATALLVSHFFTDPEARRGFFEAIADRLKPGGLLIAADIASDKADPAFESLLATWLEMMRFSGMPDPELEKFRAEMDGSVAVVPPREVENLIAAAGFETPVLFFQTLLVHAWYARTK